MLDLKRTIFDFIKSTPLTTRPWQRYVASRNAPARVFIESIEGETWHRARLNGVRLLLPAYTLRLYAHCAHGTARDLNLSVETAHADWMLSKLGTAGLFVDVGASVGTMTVPFAIARPGARIVAFEPARTARKHLLATLRRNGVSGVTVHPFAVSDRMGTASFREYRAAETCSWLPEASCMSEGAHTRADGESYDVPVTTLDAMLDGFEPRSGIVIKIDVEGFECHVLRGTAELLRRHRPWMAIDIHRRIDGMGDTEAEVRHLIGDGYSFRRLDHVLTCEP
jgi:FkbM family methyltransferase